MHQLSHSSKKNRAKWYNRVVQQCLQKEKKKKSVKRRALTPINRATLEIIRPREEERNTCIHTCAQTRALHICLYIYTHLHEIVLFVVVIAVSIRSYTAAVSAFNSCRSRDSKVTSRWRVCTDAHRHTHTGVRASLKRGTAEFGNTFFFLPRDTAHVSSLGRRFPLSLKGEGTTDTRSHTNAQITKP